MTKETVNKSEKNMYRYGLQEKLCGMYEQSKQGKCFKHLMKLIVSEENIVLAYRNICKTKAASLPELTENHYGYSKVSNSDCSPKGQKQAELLSAEKSSPYLHR